MSMKNSNDTIGNRTRDLPACSAMPQPTAPPRAPFFVRNCSEKWYVVFLIKVPKSNPNLNNIKHDISGPYILAVSEGCRFYAYQLFIHPICRVSFLLATHE
jgi:hypothetical protein